MVLLSFLACLFMQNFQCKNHIRIIVHENNRIYVCGTSSYKPRQFYLNVSYSLFLTIFFLIFVNLFGHYHNVIWGGANFLDYQNTVNYVLL